MFQKFIKFHTDLINANTPSSSRRFLGIVFSYSILIIAFLTLFTKLNIPEFIFFSLCTMALVYAGLATWSSNVALQAKSEVASNMIKSDSSEQTNDTAKETLQSDKPQ